MASGSSSTRSSSICAAIPRLADAIVVLRQLGRDDKKIAAFLKPAQSPRSGRAEGARSGRPASAVAGAHDPARGDAGRGVSARPPNGKVDRASLLALPTQPSELRSRGQARQRA